MNGASKQVGWTRAGVRVFVKLDSLRTGLLFITSPGHFGR